MSEHDGGPAFPAFVEHEQFDDDAGRYRGVVLPAGGMSLRDYFAVRVLPLVAIGHCDANAADVWVRPQHYTGLAKDAYALADAMLKVRNSGDPLP